MAIMIYNTMNRKKEEFVPVHGNRVNFYACGPTVYDYFHIGNARPLIIFDVFRRYLEYRGYEVNYIVNITDVDDKIINRANEQGVEPGDIARKFTAAYFDGAEKLGVREATVHPRATDNIDAMIEFISTLIEKGHAYEIDGDVYFDVPSFSGYGKLSGRNIDDLQSGARVEVDQRKKNPMDFALWKAVKPGEPSWHSPWGPGRPGWHIECSVMSTRFGAETLDIHAGGQDLIFPHHENEVAQSEAYSGKPFAKYWIHNGFLDIEGEKMSKSLGNFLTVKDILEKYDPMSIRMFFLLKHYRSPIDFSEERIREAQTALERLRNAYAKITRVLARPGTEVPSGGISEDVARFRSQIEEAMDDDFNTGRAMGYMFELARAVNATDENDPTAPAFMHTAKAVFDDIGTTVFGLVFEADESVEGLAGELVNFIMELRQEARRDKNWAIADRIRDGLKDMGIVIEDRPEGPVWKRE